MKNIYSHPIISKAVLASLLIFPVIGVGYFPLGNSSRYLSVWAGPISLLAISYIYFKNKKSLNINQEAKKAFTPFIAFTPFLGTWVFTTQWHQISPENDLLSRFIWIYPIFLAAKWFEIKTEHVVWACAIGAVVYFLIAFTDIYFFGLQRASGGSNEIHFAYAATWLAGICILSTQNQRASLKKIMTWIACGIFGIVASILSGTRGALIPIAALCIISILFSRKLSKKIKALTLSSIAITITSIVFTHQPLINRLLLIKHETIKYFSEPTFTFSSIGARLEMWRLIIQTIRTHPLIGIGASSPSDIQKFIPNIESINPELNSLSHLHSDILQSLATGGIILLTGLLSTIIALYNNSKSNPLLIWIISSAIIFGLTDLIFFRKIMLSMFLVLYFLILAGEENEKNTFHR
ncbi:O-antigen ligase family protein [Laribacter hongkongensis]|uniref:O-antigen ligase family protein n=1 Tax=Laribacter hongkongensis TaxID=168471 RepID=UPI001EFD6B00|nr:O-antigen ligase family protein [Laribacter hongkongensis]MCG9065531.1 O-antigen ligase family protein [Laribacter hongkongensis]